MIISGLYVSLVEHESLVSSPIMKNWCRLVLTGLLYSVSESLTRDLHGQKKQRIGMMWSVLNLRFHDTNSILLQCHTCLGCSNDRVTRPTRTSRRHEWPGSCGGMNVVVRDETTHPCWRIIVDIQPTIKTAGPLRLIGSCQAFPVKSFLLMPSAPFENCFRSYTRRIGELRLPSATES